MKKNQTVAASNRVVLRGISEAARVLTNGNGGVGVSMHHLRKVVLGVRTGRSLLEQVRARFPGLLAPGGKTWKEAGYDVSRMSA